jgi:hypothetical protein
VLCNTSEAKQVRPARVVDVLLLTCCGPFLPTGTSSVTNQRGLARWPVTSSSTLTLWPLRPRLATNQRGARAIGARASGGGL